MKTFLKKIILLKLVVLFARTMKIKPGLLKRVRLFWAFLKDYRAYKKIHINQNYSLLSEDLFPRIYDKTTTTDLDPVYFYQDTWCARKIFENKPSHHYDIASKADMIGIISQFVPTTMVDIRPITLTLPNLHFIKGEITKLPFKDNEITSLSSICVIEHIGLGRYGDSLDANGTEKSAAEMKRVLSKGGNLYISVPIDSANKIYFNAHRAFTRNYVLQLFSGLKLSEEKYIYGRELVNSYDSKRGFGTGLYHFIKE